MNAICYNQVYYVESEDTLVNLIAICPEVYDSRIQWQDTSKGKVVALRKITLDEQDPYTDLPNIIHVESIDGRKYTLIKLTIDIYNDKVMEQVVGQPTFKSTEEVQKFYLSSDFGV
jgi:hypothetical protein